MIIKIISRRLRKNLIRFSMTEDKGILIENVYHMLTYAFQELKMNNYAYIAGEKFDNIYNLFAEILYKGISYQLKQGLFRNYVEVYDKLTVLKGKIDINETLKDRSSRKRVVSCEFDEYYEDNIFNRILKITILQLIKNPSVKPEEKRQLKTILPFFDGVYLIEPKSIKWSTLQYQRNNQSYRMLMNICFFVLDEMLMTTETGEYKMAAFLDHHMDKLFEKFVLEYYRAKCKNLTVNADVINWIISCPEEGSLDILPKMNTDITIRNNRSKRTLIIDTKYYGKSLVSNNDKKILHSGHLYQLFSYVKNMDKKNSGLVSGMLLYAKTQEDITPNYGALFGNNRIRVRTLDLNQKFNIIEKQLQGFLETENDFL